MNVSPSKTEIINFFLKVLLEGIDLSVDLLLAFSRHCFFACCHCSWLVVLVLHAMLFGCSSFAQCRCSLHFSCSSLHNVVWALFLCAHQCLALGSLLDVGFLCTMLVASSSHFLSSFFTLSGLAFQLIQQVINLLLLDGLHLECLKGWGLEELLQMPIFNLQFLILTFCLGLIN